ncbi:MAG TPA: hypothetical protein VHP33_10980 [Polyangiaceae bacterium]|nr:hypothetical protein [Polyangiaceae bacterium]
MKNGAVVGVGCALMMACSMETGAPEDEKDSVEVAGAEHVGSVQSALLPWFSGPFALSASVSGLPTERRLLPTSTHVCALTRVSGKFLSDAEHVRLIRGNGEWVLQAFSGGSGVSGEAHCYRRDAFTSNDSTTLLSTQQSVDLWTPNLQTSCGEQRANALGGSAFTFINGMGGEWAGSGEWVQVEQSTVDTLPSILTGHLCARQSDLVGSSHSFRAGPASNRIATFYTNDDHWGDATTPTTLFSASGNQTVVMAKSQFTMCALTQIQGGFFGGDESVQIRNEVVNGAERWVLRTKRGAASDHVSAKARCFAKVQTT